ncbi:hypothetical protein [Sporosarcina sp. P34]|uniref:hypothetical protein n=1 Tax=Sporosarcina sp. P34 TaxID=2048247 RepID=UPI0013042969|nr:hypothetical protein [Sporosarcina sp. P34]
MGRTAERKEDEVVLEINGERFPMSAKEFGEDCLVWKNWRLLDIVKSERIRVQGNNN